MPEAAHLLEEIDLHLTNGCQLSCAHCCFDAGKPLRDELPLSAWIGVLEQAAALGVKDLDLTGGEPLLYRDLEPLIRVAVSLGFDPTLQTNALALTPARMTRLESAGLRRVMISLDGTEAAHDSLRGRGTFRRATAHAEEALRRGWSVRLNAVAMRRNVDTLADLVRWAGAGGFRFISVFAFTGQGRGASMRHEELDPMAWNAAIDDMTIAAREFPALKVVVEPAMAPPLPREACPMRDRHYLQILSDGRAYPCTMLIFSDLHLADVSREPLAACLSEERWQRLGLERFDEGCPAYDVCLTGALGPDPRTFEHAAPACPLLKLDLGSGRTARRSGALAEAAS